MLSRARDAGRLVVCVMKRNSLRFEVRARVRTVAQLGEGREPDGKLREGSKKNCRSPQEWREQTREARHEPHTRRMLPLFRYNSQRTIPDVTECEPHAI